MLRVLGAWLDRAIAAFNELFPPNTFFNLDFQVRGTLAVLLVALVCGAVGSLVVGNRMAFFSDALAHCAFAGVALGVLIALLSGIHEKDKDLLADERVLSIMVAFGVVIGVLIAYVRQKTSLANDTVIGVFFAGAMGLGAILLKFVARMGYYNLESFLFGDPITVSSADLVRLFFLVVVTSAVLAWMYNDFVLASFNPSLALSRKVRVRLCNFAFIVLLALIVNLSLHTVGALLINAMLVVPAATAANLCRNMRQLFWCTIGLCLFVGIVGQWLSWSITLADATAGGGKSLNLGGGGIMVVLSVLLFFLSMIVGPWLRRR